MNDNSRTNTKTRLELTWIGKENRPRLEPRNLLEDAARSHHAKTRRRPDDQFDNRLIFGDNLPRSARPLRVRNPPFPDASPRPLDSAAPGCFIDYCASLPASGSSLTAES